MQVQDLAHEQPGFRFGKIVAVGEAKDIERYRRPATKVIDAGGKLGAAIAGHREKTEGSLAPGKVADLIVISRDLFKIEPTEISKTQVLLTMVGGKVVYESPGWNSTKDHPATEAKQE